MCPEAGRGRTERNRLLPATIEGRLALLVLMLTGCGSGLGSADGAEDAALTPAIDDNPDPRVVEVTLQARESTKQYARAPVTPVWTYNGTIPGPVIEANVGDELIVHLLNQLPESTTIHWHGLRLPAAMDGTLAMQSPVAPGDGFDYRFVLKDAGLFWFHPHVRSDVQVEKGLHGVLRVRDVSEPVADQDRILVLDDVRVLPDGSLPAYLDDDSRMLGRQGNILLVNGQSLPTFQWQSGALERLRIVNVANGRFFNLSLPGYTWRVVGTDGGLLPQPYDTERLLVSPGERYDTMLIARGTPATEVVLTNEPYERGHDTGAQPAAPLARFVIGDEIPVTGRALPSAFPAIERLPGGGVDHEILLDEGIQNDVLVFTINGATFPDVPIVGVTQGDVRRFKVTNASEMDHPFHIHGTFFQILSVNGEASAPESLANKDTVIVPQMGSLNLAARFDEPGRWMYHCHVLEHAEGGMMGELNVLGPRQ